MNRPLTGDAYQLHETPMSPVIYPAILAALGKCWYEWFAREPSHKPNDIAPIG